MSARCRFGVGSDSPASRGRTDPQRIVPHQNTATQSRSMWKRASFSHGPSQASGFRSGLISAVPPKKQPVCAGRRCRGKAAGRLQLRPICTSHQTGNLERGWTRSASSSERLRYRPNPVIRRLEPAGLLRNDRLANSCTSRNPGDTRRICWVTSAWLLFNSLNLWIRFRRYYRSCSNILITHTFLVQVRRVRKPFWGRGRVLDPSLSAPGLDPRTLRSPTAAQLSLPPPRGGVPGRLPPLPPPLIAL